MTWLRKISFFQINWFSKWCSNRGVQPILLVDGLDGAKSILTEKSRFWQGCLQISETKSSVPKTNFLTYWLPHLTISVKLHSRTWRISSFVISWMRPYLQPHSSLKFRNCSRKWFPLLTLFELQYNVECNENSPLKLCLVFKLSYIVAESPTVIQSRCPMAIFYLKTQLSKLYTVIPTMKHAFFLELLVMIFRLHQC